VGARGPKSGTGNAPATVDGGPDDPTGRGVYDEATGLWEWYDKPEETGAPVTWEQILDEARWPLIVADFASEYGIRLHRERLMWPEFRHLIHGLLQSKSRLWRAVTPTEEEPQAPEG
jgi:hypothetical protein